ncbi:MAG: alpha/beta hydrolase, partial [Holophagales bacterium]|nr:alpha/beta hydrolase [Holophagales bacterium]
MKNFVPWICLLTVGLGSVSPGAAEAQSPPSMIECDEILVSPLRSFKTSRYEGTFHSPTGNQIKYVVIGDSSVPSSRYMILFNGTSNIWADWPVEMLRYDPLESSGNHGINLCRDYRLVLFDYPGVGGTPKRPTPSLDLDAVGNDALFLLSALQQHYGQATELSALGWSLGAGAASKFAYLLGSRPDVGPLEHLILIATRGTDYDSFRPLEGPQAHACCVSDLFQYNEEFCSDPHLLPQVAWAETLLLGLTFPYLGQTAGSPLSECRLISRFPSLELSVTPACPELPDPSAPTAWRTLR